MTRTYTSLTNASRLVAALAPAALIVCIINVPASRAQQAPSYTENDGRKYACYPQKSSFQSPQLRLFGQSFFIFFKEGSDELDDQAKQTVALSVTKAHLNAAQVTVTGHTDASGEDLENLGLSLRRAQAVTAALVNQGLASLKIQEIVGKGARAPVPEGARNAKEPRNDRVEIALVGVTCS